MFGFVDSQGDNRIGVKLEFVFENVFFFAEECFYFAVNGERVEGFMLIFGNNEKPSLYSTLLHKVR